MEDLRPVGTRARRASRYPQRRLGRDWCCTEIGDAKQLQIVLDIRRCSAAYRRR
jgi:hypothetical protein